MRKHLLFFIVGAFLLSFSVNGFSQSALDFDGSNDYLGHSTGPQPDYITVEAWIKPETLGDYEGIVSNLEWTLANSAFSGYCFYLRTDGRLRVAIGTGNTMHVWVTGANPIPTNQWTHVAMTFDGNYIKFYKNGVLISTAQTNAGSPIDYTDVTAGFRVGQYKDSNEDYYFDGVIDEVRIWDNVRSASEIANNMNSEFCGTESGLLAYYQMNCTAKPGEDKTGSFDGTVSGATSVTGQTLSAATCTPIVCNGGNDIILSSQADVDDFSATYGCDCSEVAKLTIKGSNITNVSGLSQILSVSGFYLFLIVLLRPLVAWIT